MNVSKFLACNLVLTVAALAAFAACGEPFCRTKCGVALLSDGNGTDCEKFQAAEDRAMEAFAMFVDGWGDDYACKRVKNYGVYTHEPDVPERREWYSEYHKTTIAGKTRCDSKNITVVTSATPDRWGYVLYHELAHAVENCVPDKTAADVWHPYWEEKGIFAALDYAAKLEPKP